MIVITGPGRSGTSLLAAIYAKAGIDPGGVWRDEVRAGFERAEISQLNRRILMSLGVSTLGMRKRVPRIEDLPVGNGAKSRLKKFLPPDKRLSVRRRLEGSGLNSVRKVTLINWDRVPEVAEEFGDEIRAVSHELQLVKDPQMSWTIPVWLAAGVQFDHVVATTRDISSMVDSRAEAGHLRFRTHSDARNSMIYASGVLLTSLLDFGVPHTVFRFPDFLGNLDALGSALPLPDESSREAIMTAVRCTVDPSMTTPRQSRQLFTERTGKSDA